MENLLKIGDKVNWRGAWGKDTPQETKVETIQICGDDSEYKIKKTELEWNFVKMGKLVIVSLSNGFWAYGHQLDKIN